VSFYFYFFISTKVENKKHKELEERKPEVNLLQNRKETAVCFSINVFPNFKPGNCRRVRKGTLTEQKQKSFSDF
jgi:hypothetical protein